MIQAAKSEKTSLRPVLIEYLGGFGDSEEILDYLVDTLSEESRRIPRAAGAALKKATARSSGRSRATAELASGEEEMRRASAAVLLASPWRMCLVAGRDRAAHQDDVAARVKAGTETGTVIRRSRSPGAGST